MARMFFPKPIVSGSVCFKVVNEEGKELSLAADDSCGVFDECRRFSLAKFDTEGNPIGEVVDGVDVEEYLRELAGFLGFEVVKK